MGDHHVHLHEHGPYRGSGPPPGEYPAGHIEAYVETALERGADEIGFTEHLYRCRDVDVLGRFWELEPRRDLADATERFVEEDRTLRLDRYVEAVVAARDAGLPVRLGLEVDYFPHTIDDVTALLDDYPFDFLIGSVHWVGGWAVDHSESAYEYERRGIDEAYEGYFEWEERLAASGAVDVLAHADVIKKFGHRPERDPTDLYRRVARAAAGTGTAVEVSTAGLYKPVGEIYPAPGFLAEFFAAGVPITLASDAHTPADCARDRERAVDYARDAGYQTRVRFERRVAELVPLG